MMQPTPAQGPWCGPLLGATVKPQTAADARADGGAAGAKGALVTTTTAGSTDQDGYPAPAVSVPEMFRHRLAVDPDAEAYRFPAGDGWASVTWRQTGETRAGDGRGPARAGHPARGAGGDRERDAGRVGVRRPGDHVRGRGDDRRSTRRPARRTSAYILSDSGSRIAFAEDDAQVAKLRAQRDQLPDLLRVVTFDGEADGEWVLSLDDLRGPGRRAYLVDHPAAVDEAVAAVRPEQLATLIYTSGTTGRPKGVELPHRCWTYIGAGAEATRHLSAPTTCSTCGCRCRTRSARCCRRSSCRSASRPRSTAGWTRSWRTSPWSARRSWPARRGSSRRCTPRSCRPSRRRAGSRAGCSAGPSASASRVSAAALEGRRPGLVLRAQHAAGRPAGAVQDARAGWAAGSGS